MSDTMISSEAKAALEFARKKSTSTYQLGSKIAIGIMYCVIIGCAALPFLSKKKTDVPTLDSIIYIAAVLVMGMLWMALGYLNEKRVKKATNTPIFNAYTSGSWLEYAIFYIAFVPVVLFILFWGTSKLGYFGFNYSLLFISSALCALIAPFWVVVLTIIAEISVFNLIATQLLGWNLSIENSIGMSFGLIFTAMMVFFWKNESIQRGASDVIVKELDKANAKLREFSMRSEELATTQERNRIAREIHDTLGHSLTIVNVQLEAVDALMENDPTKARAFARKARELTQRGLDEVRASVSSLRASPLDNKSLPEALQELVAQSSSDSLNVSLKSIGQSRKAEPRVELAIFRSAQEALTNVRKHAQAKEASVTIDYSGNDQLRLSIKDDGIGCEQAEGGFGLMGIRERIQFLDGTTHIITSPGKGFELSVSLPA